jgi:hypothetical protein
MSKNVREQNCFIAKTKNKKNIIKMFCSTKHFCKKQKIMKNQSFGIIKILKQSKT